MISKELTEAKGGGGFSRHEAWKTLVAAIDNIKKVQAREAGEQVRMSKFEMEKIGEANGALQVACQSIERSDDWK